MKNFIDKAFSFGVGLAAASKEQAEKLVEELVKRGEIAKNESPAYVNELVAKGEAAREKLEAIVRDRVQARLRELNVASKEDVQRLERRIEALERKLGESGGSNEGSANEWNSGASPSAISTEAPASTTSPVASSGTSHLEPPSSPESPQSLELPELPGTPESASQPSKAHPENPGTR